MVKGDLRCIATEISYGLSVLFEVYFLQNYTSNLIAD